MKTLKRILLTFSAMLLATSSYAATDNRFYVAPSTGLVLADTLRGSDDGLAIGFSAGRWFGQRWAAELGLHSISFDSESGSQVAWDEIGMRLDGQFRLLPGYRVRPYLGLGIGLLQATRSDIDFDSSAFSLEPGVGLMTRVNERGMQFRLDLRYRLEQVDLPERSGESLGETQVSIGLIFPFGPKPEATAEQAPVPPTPDRQAPVATARPQPTARATPRPLATAKPLPRVTPATPIAPIAPVPSFAPLVTPQPTPKPTPVPPSLPPISQPDATPLDDCSRTIAGRSLDERGCVVDGDADGVPDSADLCAGTPDYLPVDATGCPSDSDGDGVPDFADSCAGTPKGALVTGSGCALPETRVVGLINFATGASALTETGKGALDTMLSEVMGQLGQYPQMRVEVAGHTDNNAQAGETLGLSRYRAEQVKSYLVERGVPAARISAIGYGASEPLSDNVTIRGRLRNRRVEVRLVRKLVN